MPVIYRCIKCGEIIFTFLRAGQDYYGIPSPSELFVRVGSKCPRCGRELDKTVDIARIDVKVVK
jgi:DNA-directed RNA polymerase subunit RPC12/RpoP